MKREGFWRDVTPPLNIYGVPLPFTMIYLLLFPYPSKTTFWVWDCPDALPASVQPGAG